MMYSFEENRYRKKLPFIKLYVSCINECPISGKINNDFIVNRILKLNKMNVDNICLSDTCGTLNVDDFEYIVDACNFFGLPSHKLSLHLHVKNGSEDIVEKIIHKALDKRIIDFDVSLLETGGCSVTMNTNQIAPNLSYELYYKSLVNYIEKNIEQYKFI
jgi:pyruvate/oxaloacetate carboxyltransferase